MKRTTLAEQEGENAGRFDSKRWRDPNFEATTNPYGVDSEAQFHELWQIGYERTFEDRPAKAPVGYIRKPQAAQFLGVTVRTLDNWMKNKLVPYYKVARSVYFKESDLLEAVEKRRIN